MAVKKHSKLKTGAKNRSTPTILSLWLWEPSSAVFPSRNDLAKLMAILAVATSGFIACNSLAKFINRQPKPFCDSSSHGVPPYADWCEPCPGHGMCTDGVLYCEHGYKKYRRRCLEDNNLSQTSKKISDRVEHHVCEAYANLLCTGTGKVWFTEPEISAVLEEVKVKYNTGIEDGAFDLTKQKAYNFIEGSLETRMIANGNKEFNCPNWLAEHKRPFICAFKQWTHKHMLFILCTLIMFLGFIMYLFKVWQEKWLSARAEQLYAQICQILEENAIASRISKNKDEAAIVISWLRDHLQLPNERKNSYLWKKVEDLIQEDSRIDQYPKLIKGEAKIVLEWQAW